MLTQRQLQLLKFIQQLRPRARGLAVVRGDAGCAEAAVQVGHPPADFRAGGAGLHPPPRLPRPRARGGQSRCPRARSAAELDTPLRAGLQRRPRRLPAQPPELAASTVPPGTSLPLYGRIAAGSPIEALADTSAMIEVPGVLLGQGEHYVLQVVGQLDDRRRHLRRRLCRDPALRRRRERHHRRGPGRGPRGHAEAAAPARRLDRARARQSRLTRSASSGRTRSRSRAGWSA